MSQQPLRRAEELGQSAYAALDPGLARRLLASRVLAASVAVVLAVAVFASGATLLPAAGLGGVVGAGIGLLLGLGQLLLRRRTLRFRAGVWLAIGVAFGLWVAAALGAFVKLNGPHRTMALATIATGLIGGAAIGVTLALAQPGPSGRTELSRARPIWRWVVVVVLLLSGLVAAVYEAVAGWLAAYPAAQRSLIALYWWNAIYAVICVVDLVPGFRRIPLVLGSWLVLIGVALIGTQPLPAHQVSALTGVDQSGALVRLVWWLTDWDGDGASSWLGGGDCAPDNPLVHSGAPEVPGNGVDDNCSYGDALPLATPRVVPRSYASPPPLDVVVITMDAVRADHTSVYGYARNTTPNLVEFARRAVRFENAYTSGGWTCLALPALFSGVYPRRLRWLPMAYTVKEAMLPLPFEKHLAPGDAFKGMFTVPTDPERWTLQWALKDRGVRTIAVSNRSGPLRSLVPLLGRGWDVIDLPDSELDVGVTDAALRRVSEAGDARYFLWVHYYDAHEPHVSYEGLPTWGDSLQDRYDHEITSVDREVGRLLRGIDALRRPTAVIITADHGEAFEWGFQFHGTDLGDDVLRIPLLLRAPGLAPGVRGTPVGSVDIAPTVLALTETASPQGLDGVDLRTASGDRTIVTDLFRLDQRGSTYLDAIGVSGTRYRLTYDRLKKRRALVDIREMRRPPHELKLDRTPATLSDALGRYMESIAGGPGG